MGEWETVVEEHVTTHRAAVVAAIVGEDPDAHAVSIEDVVAGREDDWGMSVAACLVADGTIDVVESVEEFVSVCDAVKWGVADRHCWGLYLELGCGSLELSEERRGFVVVVLYGHTRVETENQGALRERLCRQICSEVNGISSWWVTRNRM